MARNPEAEFVSGIALGIQFAALRQIRPPSQLQSDHAEPRSGQYPWGSGILRHWPWQNQRPNDRAALAQGFCSTHRLRVSNQQKASDAIIDRNILRGSRSQCAYASGLGLSGDFYVS